MHKSAPQKDVVGLEVSMNDPPRVDLTKDCRDLLTDRKHLLGAHRPMNPIRERSFRQFEDEKWLLGGVLQLVIEEVDDPRRAPQEPELLCFVPERGQAPRGSLVEFLDRYPAAVRIESLPDLSKATITNLPEQEVLSEHDHWLARFRDVRITSCPR